MFGLGVPLLKVDEGMADIMGPDLASVDELHQDKSWSAVAAFLAALTSSSVIFLS